MSIAVQVHGRKDPHALAELIAATIQDGVILDREPQIAHLSALVAAEERENQSRRAAWHWLNSVSAIVDRDNDWSNL
ncbi:MAG: hypothetical protein JWO36_1898 [Myxococcales bacterium]|nr:hypothetical protein [Myxococcales bacterium]